MNFLCSFLYLFLVDCSFLIDDNEECIKNGSSAMLLVESKGHALHAFVNQKLQGLLPDFYLVKP